MASPVQIILNPENYEETREARGGGPRKDFFAGHDMEFKEHKASLIGQLKTIAVNLSANRQTDLGYLKVILRRSAWAKSHRPLTALFKSERTPMVGGAELGVMIVEGTPDALLKIAEDIGMAEDTTTMREVQGRSVPYPSVQRSETGAIENVEIYGDSDRRAFSLEQALTWLSNPNTGGSYEVELFTLPPPPRDWDRLDHSHLRLFRSFVSGLTDLGQGLTVQRLPTRDRSQPLLSVRISRSTAGPTFLLNPPPQKERRREIAPFDSSEERHLRLLNFMDGHPLVRKISLPGVVARTTARHGRRRPDEVVVPVRDTARTHPRIGIIDGGVGMALSDWVIDRWDILAEEHKFPAHGSFIGGLAVLGGSLNGSECCAERDGTELVDLAILPNGNTDAFASYYPDGLPQFFDEMETAIYEMRGRHGIRIYNMSLNLTQPAMLDRYSPHAARLDKIAEDNDAIIFVSAGNIDPQIYRTEWPSEPMRALATIAASSNDGLLTPAESIRNVSVSSVNPPDLPSSLAFAPCRFSRRGPGLKAGIKPDLAHVGGSGSPQPPLDHALFSIDSDGTVVSGCGTSYATPLVAKTAAALEHAIEGEISRETLIGLLVHNAEVPDSLRAKDLMPVARHLVGFGVPSSSDQILETGDDEITLVFASRIRLSQQVVFPFSWPRSLVAPGGKCRGSARMTLCSTPPLDPRFGSEFCTRKCGSFSSTGTAEWQMEGATGCPLSTGPQ